MIVYKITNKLDGKSYIGQTTMSLSARWYSHCKKTSDCTYLCRAIQKYGEDSFTIEELARADSSEELNDLEAKLIDKFNTLAPFGYNLKTGGSNGKHSAVTRKKMSLSKRGARNHAWGKPLSFDTRQKISKKKRGRANLKSRRPVYGFNQLTGEGIYLAFLSVAESLGFHVGNISSCCNGRLKQYRGFVWRYL